MDKSTRFDKAPHALPMASSQRGDMLLEALLSMLLVGIVGIGTAFTVSRSFSAQSKLNAQTAAIAQMREMIQKTGVDLCGTSPSVTIASTTLLVTVTCTPMTSTSVTVNGTPVDLTGAASGGVPQKSVSLSVSSTLFGGSGTLVVGD